jgi:hypothetical protein
MPRFCRSWGFISYLGMPRFLFYLYSAAIFSLRSIKLYQIRIWRWNYRGAASSRNSKFVCRQVRSLRWLGCCVRSRMRDDRWHDATESGMVLLVLYYIPRKLNLFIAFFAEKLHFECRFFTSMEYAAFLGIHLLWLTVAKIFPIQFLKY